jgi:hypothetical protein
LGLGERLQRSVRRLLVKSETGANVTLRAGRLPVALGFKWRSGVRASDRCAFVDDQAPCNSLKFDCIRRVFGDQLHDVMPPA